MTRISASIGILALAVVVCTLILVQANFASAKSFINDPVPGGMCGCLSCNCYYSPDAVAYKEDSENADMSYTQTAIAVEGTTVKSSTYTGTKPTPATTVTQPKSTPPPSPAPKPSNTVNPNDWNNTNNNSKKDQGSSTIKPANPNIKTVDPPVTAPRVTPASYNPNPAPTIDPNKPYVTPTSYNPHLTQPSVDTKYLPTDKFVPVNKISNQVSPTEWNDYVESSYKNPDNPQNGDNVFIVKPGQKAKKK
jgi:hypothetical protein